LYIIGDMTQANPQIEKNKIASVEEIRKHFPALERVH